MLFSNLCSILCCRPRAGCLCCLGMHAEGTTDCGYSATNAEMHPMTQASSGTPSTKPVAGAHSPSAITRITFGVMDIDRRAIPYLSYAYPMLIS